MGAIAEFATARDFTRIGRCVQSAKLILPYSVFLLATASHDCRGFSLLGRAETHDERWTGLREEDIDYSDRSAGIYELPPELQRLSDSARVVGDGHGLLQWPDRPQPPRILPDSGVRPAYEFLPPPV